MGEYDYEEDSAASGAVGGVEDEKCGEHLRNVTAAHEAWEDCLRSMNADEGCKKFYLAFFDTSFYKLFSLNFLYTFCFTKKNDNRFVQLTNFGCNSAGA